MVVLITLTFTQETESRKPLVVRTQQGYWKKQLGLSEDADEISERSDEGEEVRVMMMMMMMMMMVMMMMMI